MYLMLPSQKNRCGPGNAVPISSHVGFEMLKKKGVYLGNYPCGSNTINKYIYILYIYIYITLLHYPGDATFNPLWNPSATSDKHGAAATDMAASETGVYPH